MQLYSLNFGSHEQGSRPHSTCRSPWAVHWYQSPLAQHPWMDGMSSQLVGTKSEPPCPPCPLPLPEPATPAEPPALPPHPPPGLPPVPAPPCPDAEVPPADIPAAEAPAIPAAGGLPATPVDVPDCPADVPVPPVPVPAPPVEEVPAIAPALPPSPPGLEEPPGLPSGTHSFPLRIVPSPHCVAMTHWSFTRAVPGPQFGVSVSELHAWLDTNQRLAATMTIRVMGEPVSFTCRIVQPRYKLRFSPSTQKRVTRVFYHIRGAEATSKNLVPTQPRYRCQQAMPLPPGYRSQSPHGMLVRQTEPVLLKASRSEHHGWSPPGRRTGGNNIGSMGNPPSSETRRQARSPSSRHASAMLVLVALKLPSSSGSVSRSTPPGPSSKPWSFPSRYPRGEPGDRFSSWRREWMCRS